MKIGILFPGYGGQYVGMAKDLYDSSRSMQEYFDQASSCLPVNFVKLCFASSDAELRTMAHAYTAIFLTSCALFSLLKQAGIEPDLVAGFGIGQYAALFAAKSINLPDGLYLLNKFCTLYDEQNPPIDGQIIKVSDVGQVELKRWCIQSSSPGQLVTISAFVDEDTFYVAGNTDAVERLIQILDQQNIPYASCDAALGFHNAYMDSLVEQLQVYLTKVDFKDLAVPMISAVSAQQIGTGQEAQEAVVNQINQPIRWRQTMDKFSNCDIIIQVGPGTVLLELAKRQFPEKLSIALNNQADFDELKKIIFDKGAESHVEP